MNVMMTEMNLHSLVETKKRESPFKYGDSGMVGSQEITAQEFFVMKKILSLVAFLCCITLMLAGCGNTNNTPTAPTEESNDKGNRVVIYTAAEDERIAYLQEELDKHFPSDEIVIQSIGTGQLLAKLQAEGKDSDCDIFYDLEVVNAEIILNASPDLFVDLSDYDFSIYDASVTGYTDRHHQYAVNGKTAGAFLVNTGMLEEMGLPVPASYAPWTRGTS